MTKLTKRQMHFLRERQEEEPGLLFSKQADLRSRTAATRYFVKSVYY